MKKILILIGVVGIFAAFSSYSFACSGNCRTVMSFSGKHMQQSAAFIDKAKVDKKGNIKDGSQALASQKTSGSYKGKGPGAGVTAGIGTTEAYSVNKKNKTASVAIAKNISASGVIGRKACAKLNGKGEAQTVAVKGGGSAMSSGKFTYNGQVGNGAIVGGGITGGASGVQTSKNSVKSGAAHGTASGITTLGNSI